METSRGIVVLMDRFDAEIVFRPHRDPTVTQVIKAECDILPSERELFHLQLEDFAEACQGLHPPAISAVMGLESLRLLETMYAERTSLLDSSDAQVATG
jgi:hypothetical protein